MIIGILTFPGIGGEKGKNLSLSPRCLLFDRVFLSELISYSLNCLSNFQFKVQSIPQLLWFFLIPLVICLDRSHHLSTKEMRVGHPRFRAGRRLSRAVPISLFSVFFFSLIGCCDHFCSVFTTLHSKAYNLTNTETHITTNYQTHYELEICIV